MINTILQVVKIDTRLIADVKESFNCLPETDHKDGKSRLRKYSCLGCSIDPRMRWDLK